MTVLDAGHFTMAISSTLGATVLTVDGEVDGSTSDELRAGIDALLVSPEPPMNLVVDLSAMSFIDTTGLNVLVHALKRMRAYGGELTLSAPSVATRKLLAITGLDRAFTVTRV
jgi:anti-sigma B factor antagonist